MVYNIGIEYMVCGICYMVYSIWYLKKHIRIVQTIGFWNRPLSWALNSHCRILLFMRFFYWSWFRELCLFLGGRGGRRGGW